MNDNLPARIVETPLYPVMIRAYCKKCGEELVRSNEVLLSCPREKDESSRTRLLAAAMAIRASCRHGKTCKDCPFYGGENACKLGTSTPQDWQIECEV